MLPYQHTQVGYVILWVTAVIVALLAATLRLGAEREFWLALVFLALVVALFPSLTVKVDPQVIAIRFGAGPIRRRFPVGEIASAQAVRNPWYAGWGIRRGRGYWLFNVSGFEAVELVTRSGKKYRIGTDEPEALVNAIRRALATKSPG